MWRSEPTIKPMSNKWGYPEQWMFAQNDERWQNIQLGISGLTVGSDGCFATCITYLWSRKDKKEHTPTEFVGKANEIKGFTSIGLLNHSAVNNVTGLQVLTTRPLIGRFTMRNVLVQGKHGAFGHWVVELKGGLMYDPLRIGGQLVKKIDAFPPLRDSRNNIIRRYIK